MDSADRADLCGLELSVTRALLPANGNATPLQRSCEQFVASDRYAFAWIGRPDSAGEVVVPTAAAGIELDDLDDVSFRSDSPGRRLTDEAVRTREIEVERNLHDGTPDADREAHARDDGYRSMAAVPMIHDGTLHGVLHLAADRPDAFDTDERDVLVDMAETIAYALSGGETDTPAEPAPPSGYLSEQGVTGKADAAETDREAVESELRETERRLEVAAAAGSVGLWTWDVQEDVVTADEYLAETYGMDPATVADGAPMEAFYEPIHEDDEERAREQLERAVEETGELDVEYRVRNADGELAWIVARGEVEYDDGEPIRMYGAVSDVTERKRHERRVEFLNELHEALHLLTDTDEIAATLVRLLGEHLDADRCAYGEAEGDEDRVRVTGDYTRGDVPGIDGDRDAPAFGRSGIESMHEGEPFAVEDVDADERVAEDDRDAYEQAGIQSILCVPLHEDGDLAAGMTVHHRTPHEWHSHEVDLVTAAVQRCRESLERARTRRELREREQHLSALVRTTPECIKVVDEEGTLLEMNPAGLEMVQADEPSSVIGENVYDLIAPEHRQAFREFNERICRGESGTLEFDIVGLDGTRRHMETHAAPLRRPDGTASQVALTRDVTERKQRERQLEQYRTITEAASDAIVAIDESSIVRSVNPAVEEVFGYEPEALLDEPLTTLMPDELSREHYDGIQRYLDTGERRLDWDRVELPGRHADGHEVPLSISFSEYEFDGDRYFAGIIRDVTERKRFERALAGLHEASRDLIQAETRPEVSDRTVEAATNVLGLDGVGIYLFDDADNVLQPVAATEYVEDLFGELPTFGPGETSITWEAFLSGETIVHDDVLESAEAHRTDTPLRSGVWIPLGDHGVLAIVSEAVGGIDQQMQELADHLAATAEATLDRVEREGSLQEHERELAEQNRRLQELDRMNTVIREIDQELVEATTKDAIEQAVCGLLTRDERSAFAWIGGVTDGTITPRTRAGVDQGYLDEVSLEIDGDVADTPDSTDADPTDEIDADPAVTTASTGDVTVVSNVSVNLGSSSWRKTALSYDLQSAIAIPLRRGEMQYGVLTVYASQPGAFHDLARTVLEELGETIGNAMNAVETERALLTDSVVELDLAIHGADDPLVRLVTETGCEIEFQGAVPQSGDVVRIFFAASGASADAVRTAAEQSSRVEQVTLLDAGDGENHFEVTVTGPTIPSTLVECGAAARSVRITAEETRAVVELPHAIDVRTFVDRLEATYPDAELVARRDKRRDDQSGRGFETELTTELTDRQLEALQTAYLSGYFEWPRDRTGEEVAASLDITQSTFNGHLRAAERKLCQLLFDRIQAST